MKRRTRKRNVSVRYSVLLGNDDKPKMRYATVLKSVCGHNETRNRADLAYEIRSIF